MNYMSHFSHFLLDIGVTEFLFTLAIVGNRCRPNLLWSNDSSAYRMDGSKKWEIFIFDVLLPLGHTLSLR